MDTGPAASQAQLSDPDLTPGRVMQAWPETIAVFLRYRMGCIGCPIRRYNTIDEACKVHGIVTRDFLDDLERAITDAKVPR